MNRIFILVFLLIASSEVYSQKIIKVLKNHVAISSNITLGQINDNIAIQRIVMNSKIDIGKVKIIKIKGNIVLAKIIQQHSPYQIQPGDFVMGFEQKAVNNKYSNFRETGFSSNLNETIPLNIIQEVNPSAGKDFRINLEYGYSRRSAKTSTAVAPEFNSYLDDLKSGSNLNIDVAYFFYTKYGFGLKYSLFQSSGYIIDAVINDLETGEVKARGILENNYSISIIGPAVFERHKFGQHFSLVGDLMIGYISFKDEASIANNPLLREGNTIGLNFSFGLDYLVYERIALGFSASYMLGSLSEIKENGMTVKYKENENLRRFSLSAGIKMYINY